MEYYLPASFVQYSNFSSALCAIFVSALSVQPAGHRPVLFSLYMASLLYCAYCAFCAPCNNKESAKRQTSELCTKYKSG